jgi:hypothetical protein
MRIAIAAVALAAIPPAAAQDLAVAAGVMQSRIPDARSFGLEVSYTHELGESLAGSILYRNEGHVPGHHRDGHAALLWWQARPFAPELTFAIGAGPYRYFDTTVAEGSAATGFSDAHGWGSLWAGSATWRRQGSPWFWQLRVEVVETKQNLDTTMLLAMVGYRVPQDGSTAAGSTGHSWARVRDDEVFVAGGQTIVNSFESQSAAARAIEYRHAFGPVLRASLAWVHEGDARLIRRDGVAVQGWLEPSFDGDRFTLGIGYGGYLAVDDYRSGSRDLHALITTTASARLASHWVGRISWHRVASHHDRDSDIILLGMGYQF